MHERALLADLVREIERVARAEGASRVVGVRVRVGPLSHMTPAHFVEHFEDAARGTVAEGARCDVETIDPRDPLAQSIVLASVEISDDLVWDSTDPPGPTSRSRDPGADRRDRAHRQQHDLRNRSAHPQG